MLNVEKGDMIRAYDFKPMFGREDCFVEGMVKDVNDTSRGYNAYKIRVAKDVFDGENLPEGKHSRVMKIVYVPHKVSFSEFAGRVINLSRI